MLFASGHGRRTGRRWGRGHKDALQGRHRLHVAHAALVAAPAFAGSMKVRQRAHSWGPTSSADLSDSDVEELRAFLLST